MTASGALLVTVAVGAFLGSGAAFASNLLAGRIGDRRREAAALNELVHEITLPAGSPPHRAAARPARRRARPRVREGAALGGDAPLRDPLGEAGPGAGVPRRHPLLDAMTLACNRFLDESEADPAWYQLFVMQLQARLGDAVGRVADLSRGVDDLEPGNAELQPTVRGLEPPTAIGEPLR